MIRFLKNLLATETKSAHVRTAARRARLSVDSLEERCTPGGGIWSDAPSVVYTSPTYSVSSIALGGDVMLNPQPLPPKDFGM